MPVRETFWNIPHWAELAQYTLGFLVIIIFAYGVYRRVRRWRQGAAEKRTGRLGSRLLSLLTQAIGQARLAQDAYAGVMHLTIFWGMAALLVGTILATIDWDITRLLWDFQFLKDGLYLVYELALDIFGLLLLIGLGMAAYRRYIRRPQRLHNPPGSPLSLDDAYALGMLTLIAISGYLVEGLRIAVIRPDWAAWSPIGNLLASAFASLGEPTDRSLHMVIWSTHTLVSFTFIASIPFTKLFHIASVPLNIFFRSTRPAGQLAPARANGSPGIQSRDDFTWKQILDFESCTRCGRCQGNCPAFASGAALSPRTVMIKLEAFLWEKKNGRSLHGDVIRAEELWACTTCRACVQLCPAFIDHLSTFVDMRRHLVNEGQIDHLLQEALDSLGRYGNSFSQPDRQRPRWAQSIQPKIKDARKEPVEYLWVVGDYASFNANLTPITQKTAEIFQHIGLDFGIMYEGERNTGNDVRRVGEEGLFEMLVEKNTAALGRCSYSTLLTTDPHAYNTLKNEYPPETIQHRPVLHYSELFDQVIRSGQLKFSNKLDYQVTYHDPCYLGRYNEIYDAPRRVITAAGCKLVEMPRHHAQALCCGAGGGRIWMEETGAKERPSEIRVRQAASLNGVQVLVVACPKDAVMFKDAVKTAGCEGRLIIKDLSELVLEAL